MRRVAALLLVAAVARAEAPPAKGTLILDGSLSGHLTVIDVIAGVVVAEVDKAAGEVLHFTVAAGDYRVARDASGGAAIELASVTVSRGVEMVVGAALFPGGAPPPATTTPQPPPPTAPPPEPPLGGLAPLAPEKPLDAYPAGLAARPLTMPAHLAELSLAYAGNWHPVTADTTLCTFACDPHYDQTLALGFRWAPTDRLEVRNLGVYYAFLRREKLPELAAGLSFAGLGFSQALGIVFAATAAADAKQHLGARVALQLHGDYTLQVQTALPAPLSHGAYLYLDLLVDVVQRVSLTARADGEWHSLPTQAAAGDPFVYRDEWRAGGQLGLHVSPAAWADLDLLVGPAWAWGAGAAAPGAQARGSATIRFRW